MLQRIFPGLVRVNMNPQSVERKTMRKTIAIAVVSTCLSFVGGIAVAQRVHDWHDIEKVREHIGQSIHEIDEVQAANHFQMGGHAEAAKAHLRAADAELHQAVESARGY
jgi:hypothetical protein